MSSEKVRATNLNCSVVADVRHDGSEPCVDVLFGKPGRHAGGVDEEGSQPQPCVIRVPHSPVCIFPRRWVSADYARCPPHRSGDVQRLGLPHPGQERRGSICTQRRQGRPGCGYPPLTLQKSLTAEC